MYDEYIRKLNIQEDSFVFLHIFYSLRKRNHRNKPISKTLALILLAIICFGFNFSFAYNYFS